MACPVTSAVAPTPSRSHGSISGPWQPIGSSRWCHTNTALAISAASADLVSTALAELGTADLSGARPIACGWSISSWLVAHASGLVVDRVTFGGRAWAMDSGAWSQTGPAGGVLSRHQARSAA